MIRFRHMIKDEAKRILRGDKDTVVIPRKEYEYLLEFKNVREFIPTSAQKRALLKAENNFRRKKTLSYNELIQKLGFAN